MNEQIYNDFVTEVLPSIQEGLVITKDYFADLFGRYVQFLIIHDAIILAVSVIVGVVGLYMVQKALRYSWKEATDGDEFFIGATVFGCLFVIFGAVIVIGILTSNLFSLVKAIYIPEVRVYEEIQHLRNPID